ncbi:fetuin-B [Platysternon megacephalum]|uniref:Fetuin-B n=1 Tax=Platysternon megacephalum TaxID=55544 RepID=A0A4D9DTX9_9SAUR|nr:fetuin-B [Platysternon megacephalum]
MVFQIIKSEGRRYNLTELCFINKVQEDSRQARNGFLKQELTEKEPVVMETTPYAAQTYLALYLRLALYKDPVSRSLVQIWLLSLQNGSYHHHVCGCWLNCPLVQSWNCWRRNCGVNLELHSSHSAPLLQCEGSRSSQISLIEDFFSPGESQPAEKQHSQLLCLLPWLSPVKGASWD